MFHPMFSCAQQTCTWYLEWFYILVNCNIISYVGFGRPIKLVEHNQFLLKSLYQDRAVGGHVYALGVSMFQRIYMFLCRNQFLHLWLRTGFVTRVTRRVPHASSTPGFVCVGRSLVFYVMFVDHCPFVLFMLAIVLSVLHRCTVSDYNFGIFKPFLRQCGIFCFSFCHVKIEFWKLHNWPMIKIKQEVRHKHCVHPEKIWSCYCCGGNCGRFWFILPLKLMNPEYQIIHRSILIMPLNGILFSLWCTLQNCFIDVKNQSLPD